MPPCLHQRNYFLNRGVEMLFAIEMGNTFLRLTRCLAPGGALNTRSNALGDVVALEKIANHVGMRRAAVSAGTSQCISLMNVANV